MSEKQYVINPKTNRSLLVGGNLWHKLVQEGILPDDPSVKHPKELYRIQDDDSDEKINELKNELKTDEYFAVLGRGHRLEKKLMKRFKGKSHPKKQPKEKASYKLKSDSESSESSESESSESSESSSESESESESEESEKEQSSSESDSY